MATLWNKGTEASERVDAFTVGSDRVLDLRLARYDVRGSRAHIKMLCSIGLLSGQEYAVLDEGLAQIAADIEAGDFELEIDVEDIHSQVELLLTRRLGEVGKKIHSGRSRNDQVLVDLKLFLKDELLGIRDEVASLFKTLQALSERHKEVLLPGYTHGQVAMPSSFGLWFGAYAEALVGDVFMLHGAYKVVDSNPLGSGAGYGGSFPLDREMTTRLLGFAAPDYNSIAAQMSRGKIEKCVAAALGALSLTLGRFAADCCMYMSPNYGFIRFPDNLTTGSSIMPHKKNPDVWEIMRARCARAMSAENEISMLCSGLPHGYHRDFQLLKEILFPALESVRECLRMADYMLQYIEVNEHILENSIYKYMFTVEEVNARVLAGVPFRDAYRQVGTEVQEGRFSYGSTDAASLKSSDLGHTHEGSIGNLCTAEIASRMKEALEW